MDTERPKGHGVMSLTWLVAGVLALGALLATIVEPVAPGRLTAMTPAVAPTAAAEDAAAGLIYGRVTTENAVFEGQLRWGGDQEALWSNYFNGVKDKNRWIDDVPEELAPRERDSFEVFGVTLASWTRRAGLKRPFMARFGDIARIDARGRDLRVTLKSGATFPLERYGADDMNDGVRVWDSRHGVVNLGEWGIRTIEFLPSASPGAPASPLHGTVRTRQGDFTGLVQWDRKACLASDELVGRSTDGELRLPFSSIRSIARQSSDSSLVTLVDGRTVVMSGSRQVAQGNSGIYVDDHRYGRVLVSWDAFARVDFSPGGGTSPAYGDFAPGSPLQGAVTTRDGRRLAGRLVYDLDESQTTETVDAPLQGIDYTIPFSLIASIARPGHAERGVQQATVLLRSGEELRLERSGDLGEGNAGILVFVEGDQRPEYVRWADVQKVDFATGAGPLTRR
jgi:hypothetical protein